MRGKRGEERVKGEGEGKEKGMGKKQRNEVKRREVYLRSICHNSFATSGHRCALVKRSDPDDEQKHLI